MGSRGFSPQPPYNEAMKKAVIEGDAYAPVEDVYSFFMDFDSYGRYSEYVDRIRRVGDMEWEITFKWWKARYTSRSRVVDYEENEYIEWEVTKDVKVQGIWRFEEVDDEHTRISLHLWYDPRDASKANPLRYVPTSRLIALAKPVLRRHVDTVLRRITEELEGRPRDVDYTVEVRRGGRDEFLDFLSGGT